MWLVGLVALGIVPFLPRIYPSWTSGRLSIDVLTLTFLLVRMTIWGSWSGSLVTLCAINKQKLVAYSVIGAAGITCLLATVLIPRMGISGAALSQLLGDLAVSAWLIPFFASKEIKDCFGEFTFKIVSGFLMGIVFPALLGLIGWRFIHSELMRFLILTPAVFGLALLIMWKQLASDERFYLRQLVSLI